MRSHSLRQGAGARRGRRWPRTSAKRSATRRRRRRAGGNVHRDIARGRPRVYTLRRISRPTRRTRKRSCSTRSAQHDKEFGRAYAGLAMSYLCLGRREEAQGTGKRRFSLIDRMTEREKLRTMGGTTSASRGTTKRRSRIQGAGHQVPGRLRRPQQPRRRPLQPAQFRQGARARPEGHRDLPEELQVPRELCALRDVRRGLPHAATTAQELIKENPKIEMAYLPLAMEAFASGDSPRARAPTSRRPEPARPAHRWARWGSPTSRCTGAICRRHRGAACCGQARRRPGQLARRGGQAGGPRRSARRAEQRRRARGDRAEPASCARTACWSRRHGWRSRPAGWMRRGDRRRPRGGCRRRAAPTAS